MNKLFSIIIFLLLIGLAGFFFGSQKREVEYIVNGQVATSAPALAAEPVATNNIFFGLVPADKLSSIPWYVSRSAAIVSYLIMFLVIILGVGMTTGFIYRLTDPVKAWSTHQYLSISLGVTVSIHIVSIFFDKFINFTIADLLVPFVSDYKTAYLSLGIIGFYLLLATVLFSIFLRLKTPRFWRVTHFLVYPLFTISLIHGYFIGSDSTTLAMQLIYQLTGLAFIVLVVYRFIIYPLRVKA